MATSDVVHFTKSDQLTENTGQTTGGMVRLGAIYDVSDKLNANIMIAQPHSSSAVHHHGDQDTVVYGKSGHGAVVYNGGKDKVFLGPGDWCLIPGGVEHQEVNESDEEQVMFRVLVVSFLSMTNLDYRIVWVIVRSGKTPCVSNLSGWGELHKKDV